MKLTNLILPANELADKASSIRKRYSILTSTILSGLAQYFTLQDVDLIFILQAAGFQSPNQTHQPPFDHKPKLGMEGFVITEN
jgi:hypothetical protein